MNSDKREKSTAWWQPAMEVFVQISGWIVFPIILALLLGNWLDNRFGTSPRYVFLLVGVAFVVTNIGLVKTTLTASKKIQSIIDIEKKEKNKEINKDKS